MGNRNEKTLLDVTDLTFSFKTYAGEVQANPYELNGSTGCDYCAYRDICGFDPRLDGYAYRSLEKYSKEEVIRRMEEEIENREEPS